MAYSFAEISSDEQSLRNADKPMLIAQTIPRVPTFAGWNQTGTVAGGDSSAAGYPASRGYDGLCHLPTKPDSAQSVWYYVMQFPSPGIEFDWIGFFSDSSNMTTFDTWAFDVADDAAFSVNVRTILMPTPTNDGVDRRITQERPRHFGAPGTDAIRYSNVEYIRFQFGFLNPKIPELGELILGRRRQLKHKPRTPYDDIGVLNGDHADSVTAAGVRHRYTYNDGRRRLEASINPSYEPYLSDIPAWFRTGQQYGRSPFAWSENPGSDPGDEYGGGWHWMMMEEPMLSYPVQDFVERTFDIVADEQGPERFYLEREP